MYDLHAKSFKNYYSANKIDILYLLWGWKDSHKLQTYMYMAICILVKIYQNITVLNLINILS